MSKRRAWRYHSKFEPKIFEDDAIEIAERAGWVDSPAKVEHIDKINEDKINGGDNNIIAPENNTGSGGGDNDTGGGDNITAPENITPPNTGGDGDNKVEGGDSKSNIKPNAPTEEEISLGFSIPVNLKGLSVKKLKKVAKYRGKTGYSSLNEDDLISLIEG